MCVYCVYLTGVRSNADYNLLIDNQDFMIRRINVSMTENQAKKIFEKYNSADNIVRSPNGRAKMRKPLDTYAKAAVNLYGIIRRDEFAEIFNAQNEEQTIAEEVYTILLPSVLKSGWYGFYKVYIVHYAVLRDFGWAGYLERAQAGKPCYIPPKEQFLQFKWEEYEDNNHWYNVRKFMWDAFGYGKGTAVLLKSKAISHTVLV